MGRSSKVQPLGVSTHFSQFVQAKVEKQVGGFCMQYTHISFSSFFSYLLLFCSFI